MAVTTAVLDHADNLPGQRVLAATASGDRGEVLVGPLSPAVTIGCR